MSVAEMLPSQPGSELSDRSSDRAGVIVAAVRTAIGEQRLLPGTKLPEDQLGGIFGVSRTLVRAALQALARDGMVLLTRNKGATIASPTVAEARALFDARRVIEAALVSRAALAAKPAHVRTLERLVDDGRDALDRHDRGRAIRLSGEFHLAVSRIASQPVLHDFLCELVARSSLVIALYGHSTHSECGDGDHRKLIAVLRSGDPAAAVDEMIRHLDAIERDLDFNPRPSRSIPLAELLEP